MKEDTCLDQASAVRAGEEIDLAALQSYLRERLLQLSGPLHIEQFPQGFSNLTYLLRCGEHEFVLRRPPMGANIKSGHDMSREFRILSALIKIYPKVPAPVLYCDDDNILRAPFYLMQRVHGVILRNRAPQGLELKPELMQRICLALIDTMVELHSIDYTAAGLHELARAEGYVERQISGWTKRYANAKTDEIAEMEQAAQWLASHQPSSFAAALIHNDYRYDNVVLDPNDLSRIIAILDWEMATIGDPLMDVGTTLAYWAEANDPIALRQFGLTSLPGNLNRQEFVERYAERSGRVIGNMLFYFVYGLFKLGVIAQQIYARYRLGFTRDERFGQLIHAVRACGQTALLALEKDRIHDLFV
ncbi:MAG: phosphotransferase family protein [candidate division KSB1 bacterium]